MLAWLYAGAPSDRVGAVWACDCSPSLSGPGRLSSAVSVAVQANDWTAFLPDFDSPRATWWAAIRLITC